MKKCAPNTRHRGGHGGNAELPRVACDSLVALPVATADGTTLFAKNSDRPAMECQPLVQSPRRRYDAGSSVRCTYIAIPQVAETARLIGSRPFWCWGFEHGLNEYGVAIGNHTIFTKAPLSGLGLIGMDLVRLGLERSRTAEQAVDVITTLAAAHGQGGSGYVDKDWSYHNSFLIADRSAAFLVETSDRRWVVRRIHTVGSATNHATIGDDWDAIADGTIEDAIAAGWWSEDGDVRFDFAAAYRDTSLVPDVISSGRHRRTCALLEQAKGRLTVAELQAALRDHYGGAAPRRDATPADPEYFSVCMHADPVGTTTASMVARIPTAPEEPPVYWASLGSPCVGAFLPLFVDGQVPASLSRGGEQPSEESPWWQCKRLLGIVEQDWEVLAPQVRRRLDPLEAELRERTAPETLRRLTPAARSELTSEAVDSFLTRVNELLATLAAR